jgi:hypothetical protein
MGPVDEEGSLPVLPVLPPKKLVLIDLSFSGHTYQPRRDSSNGSPLSRTIPIISWMRHPTPGCAQRTRYVACLPKGYRTMLANHDLFTRQMRRRLKTTCIGLGLARLLQDARRFEEAKTTLYSLENGFQGVPVESDDPSLKPFKADSCSSASVTPRIDTAETLTTPTSIA